MQEANGGEVIPYDRMTSISIIMQIEPLIESHLQGTRLGDLSSESAGRVTHHHA